MLEKAFEKYEKAINDDEDDLEYSKDLVAGLNEPIKRFLDRYNIDYSPEEPINNSSFIKIPEWVALKRSVLNLNNNDNKCFQYSVTLYLYHEQIGRTYCRISKIKLYINNFNWENINFPPQEQD